MRFITPKAINSIIENDAENRGVESPRITQHMFRLWENFEWACLGVLYTHVDYKWLKEGVTVETLLEDNGVFLIYMTLAGEGIGIWDGSWDEYFYEPQMAIPLIQDALKELSLFVDYTGGGLIKDEIDSILNQAE